MNYSAVTQQMMDDAAEVALAVLIDFGFPKGKISLAHSLYLCECHGNALPLFCTLPPRYAGRCYYDGPLAGRIEVSRTLRGNRKITTILHELTHRICMCSERFEHLNRPCYANYDFKDFHELIAMIVTDVAQILINRRSK